MIFKNNIFWGQAANFHAEVDHDSGISSIVYSNTHGMACTLPLVLQIQ